MNNRLNNANQSKDSDRTEQRKLDKNKTLNEDAADVVDYGRSNQKARESQSSDRTSQDNQRNGDMPLDKDETMGNP